MLPPSGANRYEAPWKAGQREGFTKRQNEERASYWQQLNAKTKRGAKSGGLPAEEIADDAVIKLGLAIAFLDGKQSISANTATPARVVETSGEMHRDMQALGAAQTGGARRDEAGKRGKSGARREVRAKSKKKAGPKSQYAVLGSATL